ncbi:unnamed protein product [Hyaloperonospora brassicae]|uniref:Aspartyl/asparaginy/proline hydroxylase domain-containing protein n=1 Tax=Hyaloperonospora brassicae TaxID=162125 RepID=A0AAV0UDP9_HYABA|nr:unnamed protein product [Hyaloperonospora brassicae]
MTSGAPPGRAFYDGVFRSPLFTERHRVCCNVGYRPRRESTDAVDVRSTAFQTRYPHDVYQLQLYDRLLDVDGQHATRRHEALTILDVGCGAGGGLCELQLLYPQAHVVGLDVSSAALERCKEVWSAFLQHLDRAVRELARVVKPRGLLFVADFIPLDTAADHVERSLLSQHKTGGFHLVQEQLVSYEAAMGAQHSSDSTRELIHRLTPSDVHAELETFFFVERSPLYELLRRDQLGYRLLCLRRTDERRTDEEEDVCHVTEWDRDSDGDSAGDTSDEEIHDEDLASYYPYQELFPQLDMLSDNYSVIVEEMQAVQQVATWPFWPEKHYTNGDSEWRVFPFCYTFPACDASKTTWVPATCSMCPRTAAILKSLPGVRTALFSKLGPNTTLNAHRGWADLANHVLRVHFPLIVPTLSNGEPCCAMVVGGETTYHNEREFIVFDDSKLHYAFNHHPDETRLVLIVDFYRPDHLPRGRARGGHSDELDEFIESFGNQTLLDGNGES